MHVRRPIALAVFAVVAFAACGEDAPDTAPAASDTTAEDSLAPATTSDTPMTSDAPTTTAAATTTTVDLAAALGGRTFLSTSVEGYELVDGTQIQLSFDGANISAAGGCNQIASTWSLDGDVLVVTEPVMTMMACQPAALMDQDTWLSSVLTSNPTIVLDDDTLTLTADGAVVTLVDREVADPDRPLEGTTWNLEGIVANEAVSSVPTGGRIPTVRFDGGTLAIDTGCNRGTGAYELADADIVVQPIATTRAACIDPASTATEQAMLVTLDGTVAYAIEADVLTLTNGDTGLVLRAAPEGGTTPEGLEGQPWLLDSYRSGSTTTAIAAGVRKPTIQFDAGTVTVDTGCNTGSGTYTLAGDQITFGPILTTLIACEGITNDVEQAILSVLTGTATAAITDGVLTLTNGDQALLYTTG